MSSQIFSQKLREGDKYHLLILINFTFFNFFINRQRLSQNDGILQLTDTFDFYINAIAFLHWPYAFGSTRKNDISRKKGHNLTNVGNDVIWRKYHLIDRRRLYGFFATIDKLLCISILLNIIFSLITICKVLKFNRNYTKSFIF